MALLDRVGVVRGEPLVRVAEIRNEFKNKGANEKREETIKRTKLVLHQTCTCFKSSK